MRHWNLLLAGCALALTVFIASPADAQWGGGGGQRQRPSAEEIEKRRQEARTRLFETLKLDDAQTKLVDSLLTVRDEKMMEMVELMRASFGDREMMREMRGEMQDLQVDTEKKIDAVLTEEQRLLYKEYREKERENRRWGPRRRGGQAGGGGGDAGGSDSGGDTVGEGDDASGGGDGDDTSDEGDDASVDDDGDQQ
jgi:hypothetical protein